MNKIALAGPVWLASDVHLGQNTVQTSEAFRDFLKLASKEAAGLLLPGDIFDAWIGTSCASFVMAVEEWVIRQRWRALRLSGFSSTPLKP